eukprot:GILK01006830.1.p1 GENE.GILK01006830.1~~GILK01006830.1.p1  ORF type:complete len:401 (+),score=59.38 GILK01006830.1:46-1248(+)
MARFSAPLFVALAVAYVAHLMYTSGPTQEDIFYDWTKPIAWPAWPLAQWLAVKYRVSPRQVGPPQFHVMDMLFGYYRSQAMYVADRLKVADLLRDGPLHIEQIAAAANARPNELARVLRLLTTSGMFEEQSEGVFANNRMSSVLRSDHPTNMSPVIGHFIEDGFVASAKLIDVVRGGGSSFEMVHNESFWNYLSARPQSLAQFEGCMSSINNLFIKGIVAGYDWGRFQRVLDIGGSMGLVLASMMYKHTQVRGVLFDLPEVIEGAKKAWPVEHSPLLPRVELVAGSMFEATPAGQDGDLFIMKTILHDWNDESCVSILKQLYTSMRGKQTTLILIEIVIGEPERLLDKVSSDVHMMSMFPGGKERTTKQWSELFDRAGFKLIRVTPLEFTPYSAVEAVTI